MKGRVRELVEAATVLSGAGDREGAMRLVDEALRLAPQDAAARAFRDQLSPPAPTPFAPPPPDLFGGPPAPSANPFVRPGAPGASGPGGAQDLEKLLLGAAGALQPPTSPTDPAGVVRPSSPTATFGAPPSPPASEGAPPSPADDGAPKSSGTLPYAQRPDATPPPSSSTLHFAQRPDAVSPSATVPFGTRPAPVDSEAASAPGATLLAGAAAPDARAPAEPLKRPPSSPGSARTGTMLSGGRPARPKSKKPGTKGTTAAAATSPSAPRPSTSAPYDPMELIDAPPASAPGALRADEALKGARQLLEFADHSGALALVEQVLAESPSHAEALALKARCEATLTSMFESKLGDLSRRPRLRLRADEVIWLNLDHRAGFVLAQIDGQVSLEDLFDLSGMPRLDTAKILVQLLEEKVIQL